MKATPIDKVFSRAVKDSIGAAAVASERMRHRNATQRLPAGSMDQNFALNRYLL